MNKDISSSKIFIIGFAFKGDPETSDLRDSTTLWLLENLKEKCPNISGYDPVLDENEISDLGVTYSEISSGIHNADVVMLMNNHKSYVDFNIQEFAREMNCPGIIYDSWGMVRRSFTEEIPGIEYMGVGF